MADAKIGFLGLGLMGGAMVSRLQDKAYAVTVLGNRDRTQLDKAIARGAVEAADAASLAAQSDIVMLCMGTSEHVEGRMRGETGVIAGMTPGTVVIDFGTSIPASTEALGAEVAAKGGTYLDAPLGRTPDHAYDGLLNIMCSGDEAAFTKVKPVLEDLGENVFHLGALGTGHKIKLMNNFIAQTFANALSEGFAMCDLTGVPRQSLYDVMRAGPVGSPFMDFMAAHAMEGDPSKLAFSITNAAKDLGYYEQMTQDAGAPSIMVGGALGALRAARDSGHGDDMVPEMIEHYCRVMKRD